MGVDPFAALGIEQSPPVTMGSAPKKGVDPFAALGIDTSVQYPAEPSPAKKPAGIAANLAAGANQTIFGAAGAPVDAAAWAMNLPGRAINAAIGTNIPRIEHPVGGSEWIGRQWQNLTGVNPSEVQPVTEAERMAQSAGGAVAQVPLMAMGGAGALRAGASGLPGMAAGALEGSGGATAGQAAQIAAATGAGGAAGQLAEDKTTSPALKPFANLAGNVGGAGASLAGMEGVRAGWNALTEFLGRMGVNPPLVGSKQNIGGVTANDSQTRAAGSQVSNALGEEGRGIVARATETEQEARALEAQLADPATMSADQTAARERLNEIQGRRVNLIPGSDPTLAQLAPTSGTVALEKAHRVADAAPFNERAGEQNNARVAAIQGVQPDGNPGAVGALLRQHLDALDRVGQAAVGAARQGVQGATEALGGQFAAEQSGADIRGALMERNKAAKTAESALWKAIDPDGKLALPLGTVQQTARGLIKEMDPRLGDVTSGPENQILTGAAALPEVVPFKDAQRLWSNIGTAQRALRATPGNDQSLRRLGLLKGSLSDAIAEAAANSADEGVASRINAFGRENGPVVSGGSGQGIEGGAGLGAAGVPGPRGVQREGGGGSGSATGDSGVATEAATRPGEPGLESNFTAENAAQYATARQATRERHQTFDQGPIGAALRQGPAGAPFHLEEGAVPRQFLTGNSVEPARVRQYIEAVGGAPQAVQHMREALVNDLHAKGIVQQDGTIKPEAYAKWIGQRGQTIDQFPGLRAQLADAGAAQQTLDEVGASHVAAVRDFQKDAASNFLNGDEPIVAIGKAFGSGNPTETFTQLANSVRGNPDAEAGLRRGVVDYIMQKMSTTSPSGASDIDFLKADGFRKWVRDNRSPLRVLFGGQGAQNLEMVAADLRRQAQRATATAGSDTTANNISTRKLGLTQAGHGLGLTALTLIGEHLGQAVHGSLAGSIVGAVALPAMGTIIHSMRQAGINTINDLVREAMLHPELAQTLMRKAPKEGVFSPLMQRQLGVALQSAVLADQTSQRKDH